MTSRKVKSPKSTGKVTQKQAKQAVRVVNLSVHKNNKEQRRKKELRKSLISSSKYLSQTSCVEGYFLLSWDKDGSYQTRLHDPEGVIGLSYLPSFTRGCAQRAVSEADLDE
jgi:hypothetical protein